MSNRNTRGDSTRVFNPDDIIVRERQTRNATASGNAAGNRNSRTSQNMRTAQRANGTGTLTPKQAKKQEKKREGIVVSTLHAVKGLEYDKVYIMNVNEGSIPYKKAVLEEALEEERRLFYVGMTRAKKELTLCYVRRQYEKERDPSRFLEETGL